MNLSRSPGQGFSSLPFLILVTVLSLVGLRLAIQASAAVRCLILSQKAPHIKQNQLDTLLSSDTPTDIPAEPGIYLTHPNNLGWGLVLHHGPTFSLPPFKPNDPPATEIWCPPAMEDTSISAYTCTLTKLHGSKTVIIHGNLHSTKLTIGNDLALLVVLGEVKLSKIVSAGGTFKIIGFGRSPDSGIVIAETPPTNQLLHRRILGIRKL